MREIDPSPWALSLNTREMTPDQGSDLRWSATQRLQVDADDRQGRRNSDTRGLEGLPRDLHRPACRCGVRAARVSEEEQRTSRRNIDIAKARFSEMMKDRR